MSRSLLILLFIFTSTYKCRGFRGNFHLKSTHGSLRPLKDSKSSIADTNEKLFDLVKTNLGLKLTGFTDDYDGRSWKYGEWSGSAEWWDEQKGSKLTGVTKAIVNGPNGVSAATLNVWMGPGLMVPHLLLTAAVDPSSYNGVSVTADYLPRGPTPIGSDETYLEMYYGKDVQKWYSDASSQPGAVSLPPSPSLSARLLRSPAYLAVGGLDDSVAAALCTQHVERWLRWISEARPVEARQKGAINGRDDKQRQFFYRGMVGESIALVGTEFGPVLAACRTGPVAEAYVGGGG